MRLVFSSFAVGLAVSTYGLITMSESIRTRKYFLEPKFDEEEFTAFLYEAELKNKLQGKKYGEESVLKSEARKFINNNVVPVVREGVNQVFSLPVQQYVDQAMKAFEEQKQKLGQANENNKENK